MFLYILIFGFAVAMMYTTLSSEKKYQAMVSTWHIRSWKEMEDPHEYGSISC